MAQLYIVDDDDDDDEAKYKVCIPDQEALTVRSPLTDNALFQPIIELI